MKRSEVYHSMHYDNLFSKRLAALETDRLYRTETPFAGPGPLAFSSKTGSQVLSFGSNDYLGLSVDPRVRQAAAEAIDRYGTGSTGSRLTTGTFDLHHMLEAKLARLKKTEDCMVFSSGYGANIGILGALCDREWHVFSDRLNHASIIDGCAGECRFSRYRHLDTADLADRLEAASEQYRMIVTDGVFSMDGDVAPLPEIVSLAERHNALVMVDDAHGLGVIGDEGMGTVSHYGLQHRIHLQMGTLSKATGAMGGYVAGSRTLIGLLRNTARSYVFTTALPPSMTAAALAALDIITSEPEPRNRLALMADSFRSELRNRGFNVIGQGTPIIPVITGDTETTLALAEKLWEDGIHVPAIRPPTVPHGSGRLRVTLTALHQASHIDKLVECLTRRGHELGLTGNCL